MKRKVVVKAADPEACLAKQGSLRSVSVKHPAEYSLRHSSLSPPSWSSSRTFSIPLTLGRFPISLVVSAVSNIVEYVPVHCVMFSCPPRLSSRYIYCYNKPIGLCHPPRAGSPHHLVKSQSTWLLQWPSPTVVSHSPGKAVDMTPNSSNGFLVGCSIETRPLFSRLSQTLRLCVGIRSPGLTHRDPSQRESYSAPGTVPELF